MKRLIFLAVMAIACSGATLAAATPGAKTGAPTRYVVLYDATASPAAAKAAINQAGGRLLRVNARVGVATVVSANPNFRARVTSSTAIEGVARNRSIGSVPSSAPRFSVEMMR